MDISKSKSKSKTRDPAKIALYLLLAVYLLYCFRNGLENGGRWDLYQHIAMADRFLAGKGLYYSPVEASTPYFPGLAYLSVLVGRLCFPLRDKILLCVASIIGTAFLAVLASIGRRTGADPRLVVLLMAYAAFYAFDTYRMYMWEFKADSLVMLLASCEILLLDRAESTGALTPAQPFLLFLLSFLMDITKQQSLYVDIALGLYLLLSRRISLPKRIALLTPMILGGVAALSVMLPIPGLFLLTVENLSSMPFSSLARGVTILGTCFRGHLPFFALLSLFPALLRAGRIRLDGVQSKWLIASAAMGLGQIAGGLKIGGNVGNFEMGMICFMPFAILTADALFQDGLVEDRKRAAGSFALAAAMVIAALHLSEAIVRSRDVADAERESRSVSAYLSENMDGERILYDSDDYMRVIRSTAVPGMDMLSIPRFVEGYGDSLKDALREGAYQYLYIDPDRLADQHADDELARYYRPIEDAGMPAALRGKLYVRRSGAERSG